MLSEEMMHQDHALVKREVQIKDEMLSREKEFTDTKTIKIFTGTWNVNEQYPVELDQWLQVEGAPPDIYAIGFQESCADLWLDQVDFYLAGRGKYIEIDRFRLQGIMLVAFIKWTLYPSVKNVASTSVATGAMGIWGNKGGVSIRFELHNTSICFVNSHLAAGVELCQKRNEDYKNICEKTLFKLSNDVEKKIEDHDQVYWMGDLNYRLALDTELAKECLRMKQIECLLKFDQLRKHRKNNVVFSEFEEGPITFQPTYKYDLGTDVWDTSKKCRGPAWCDRILWRGNQITQLTYKSHPELNESDHKPVSATFKTNLCVISDEKRKKVYKEVIRKLDKLENELIPQLYVDRNKINFGTVKYFEPVRRSLVVTNIGQVPAKFEFMKKLEDAFCKPWLTIEPIRQCISSGESCEIILEVFINENHAHRLSSGKDKIEDTLTLHTVHGNDVFISILGELHLTCFGCSMEVLVQIREPIKNLTTAKIVELGSEKKSSLSLIECYAVSKEIWFLVDHLCLHGLKIPNLFKKPGLHSEVLKIRDWLDSGCTYTIEVGIHSYSEALILLLESAGDAIIPYKLCSVCVHSSHNSVKCKEIIDNMPELRKNTFYYLSEFLREVLRNKDYNGSDVKSICKLFGPIFLKELPNKSAQPRTKEVKQCVDELKATFLSHFVTSNDNHNQLVNI